MARTIIAVDIIDVSGPCFRIRNSDGTSEEFHLEVTDRGVRGYFKLKRLCKRLGIDVPNDTSKLIGCSYLEAA